MQQTVELLLAAAEL